MTCRVAMLGCLAVVVLMAGLSAGATVDAYPGDNLGSKISGLGYGDTLIVHSVGGNGTGRYSHFKVYGKIGDDPATPEEEWITVQAADGEPRPVIYEPRYDQYNLVELLNTIRYLKFVGLEFDSGSDSIKLPGTVGDHIVFEDLYMHNIGDVGINLSSVGNVSDMLIRGCEIHDAGYAGTGEGMYLGKHGYQGDGTGILRNSIIEYNHVYDCGVDAYPSNQGDGIEMKYECYGNVIRDNVVHDTKYPGILVYGTARPGSADNNLVTRNVVWGSGDWALTAFQTTTITNNIVFDSSTCLQVTNRSDNSGTGHDGSLRDVYVYNNTFYYGSYRTAALYIAGRENIEIVNNLFYQPVTGTSIYCDGVGGSGFVASSNYYNATVQNVPAGFTQGPDPFDAFVNPTPAPSVIDLYLQSGTSLENGGDNAFAPADDFNGTIRPIDVVVEPGAYEISGPTNPGWQIAAEFKPAPALPALVSSDPEANTTLSKTQNNVIQLTFDGPIVLPATAALSVVAMDGGAEFGDQFACTVEPDGVTLKAVENGAVLTHQQWYRVEPSAAFGVQAFSVELCALIGDANADGQVLAADLGMIWSHNAEMTDARYDINGDGQVLAADLGVTWSHNADATPAKP